MDDAAARETRGILFRFGDIVAMRQENVCDAAEVLEPVDEMRKKFRRVNEPVALGTHDEITVAAERFRGIEAAVIHAVFERHREIDFRLAGGGGMECADRTGRTGEQSTGCATRG